MLLRWKSAIPFFLAYNVDDGDGGGGDGNDTDTDVNPNGDGGTDAATATAGDDKTPKFTQAQINKMMAEHKRNLQKQVDSQVKELEGLRKSKNLSEKEKVDLSKRIEDLQNSILSKEELASKERERLTVEHKRQAETLSQERDFYKNLYTTSTIENEIRDHASKQEAFREEQLVDLLKPKARLTEVLDHEGNPVPGKYVTRIKLEDVDKEGKPTTLDVTVPEALKRMKERTNEFGNLFKSGVSGGLGDGKNRSSGKEKDPKDMGPEEFRKWRKIRGY